MNDSQKEILIASGVDLEGALERFMGNEKLYENYLHRFETNPNFPDLEKALNDKNWEEALGISHNLKGVTGTLGFNKLYELFCSQVDLLRSEDCEDAAALMGEILPEYRRLLDMSKEVDAAQ